MACSRVEKKDLRVLLLDCVLVVCVCRRLSLLFQEIWPPVSFDSDRSGMLSFNNLSPEISGLLFKILWMEQIWEEVLQI